MKNELLYISINKLNKNFSNCIFLLNVNTITTAATTNTVNIIIILVD